MKHNLIPGSFKVARDNWNDWRDVFEHKGRIRTNPLLADQRKFASFCTEYSVTRTIRRGTQNKFRLTLAKSPEFASAIRDNTGRALDKLERRLRKRFGTHNGRNGMVSVVSKVAAFVRPERIVAWDNYAKRGVNKVLGRSVSYEFNTYAEYLAAFEEVWKNQTGREIREYVATTKGAHRKLERDTRFQRRVLDVFLMICGGRKLRVASVSGAHRFRNLENWYASADIGR